MKILYVISVHGHGRGGHFHSLNQISKILSKHEYVRIISFGSGVSPIIEKNPNFQEHIFFNGLNLFYLVKKFKQILKANFDVIHFFDDSSYNIMRLFLNYSKTIVYLNKCGGANRRFYPKVQNLILFSKENQIWFNNKKKYRDSNIFLFPYRVERIQTNSDNIPYKKEWDSFTFMRICRIGIAYKKSIQDSYNLLKYLLSHGFENVKLYIIGAIEDISIFERFYDDPLVRNGKIIFITENKLTEEASKMLFLADAVIGTGRGLMEASSLGIPLLTLNIESDIPILITENNFFECYFTNFSERNVFKNFDENENLDSIKKLINNIDFYNKQVELSRKIFDEFFNVEKVWPSYIDAYRLGKIEKRMPVFDIIFTIKSIIGFYRSDRTFKQTRLLQKSKRPINPPPIQG
ncbi:MAG: hypothetical protein ACOX0D_00110 [Sphaerochaeta sp.]|jgi:glycosyltransferase involved in cell wall biosynthesis